VEQYWPPSWQDFPKCQNKAANFAERQRGQTVGQTNQNGGAGRGRAKCKDDRTIKQKPLSVPEYPFSSHVFDASDGDTCDQLLIEHSEKRL